MSPIKGKHSSLSRQNSKISSMICKTFLSCVYTYNIIYYCSFTQKELTPLGTMDLIVDTDSKIFKLRTINLALQLLDGFCENFDHSSQFLIVEPLVPLLQLGNYGRCLNERVQTVLDRIMILKKKKLYRLVTETKRPKPLKLYEPKIEDV